ncbi:MAG: exopolysaccharide biosynthesis polyprenyl glycosylphosphotransferase [Erysipelotrichaceae bacterium]|nr:exopolysaccharide biosynthesis polyprenyl glycosylphosphotransferase [Erysipelotrichaceae bacterium]
MIKDNQAFLKIVRIVYDYFIFIAGFYLVFILRLDNIFSEIYEHVSLIALLGMAMIGCYASFNIYNDRKIIKIYDEASLLFLCHVLVLMGFLITVESRFYTFIFKGMLISLLMTLTNLYLRRKLIIKLVKKGWYKTDVIVVGSVDLISEYLNTVTNNERFGHFVVANIKLDETPMKHKKALKQLKEAITTYPLTSLVVLGLPLSDYNELNSYIEMIEKQGLRSTIIPDFQRYLPAKPAYDMIGNTMLINSRTIPLDNIINKVIKRTFDISVSLMILILFLPLFVVVAILIKTTSKGPLFYRQERIGFNNKVFMMLKFRSMTLAKTEEAWSPVNEARVTKIGKVIRKLSIDECPQFINVLLGEMSIIGPRPERPKYVKAFSEEIPKYNIKHRVKPGITGLAQVNGYRGDTSIIERIKYDLYYVENWTVQMDLYIMLRTILLGFVNHNE